MFLSCSGSVSNTKQLLVAKSYLLAEKGPVMSVFMSPAAEILPDLASFTCSPTQVPPAKNSSDSRVPGDPCNAQDLKSSSFEERVKDFFQNFHKEVILWDR